MSRPELIAAPDVFYDATEASKYGHNTRMLRIQTEMTERALQLLRLDESRPNYLLDVGTGSGLSGEVLSEHGYAWVGVDISPSMLGVALEREVEGDLICADMGQGMNFRPSTFDGCVSISALQWLCNADESDHIPQRRLKRFFTSLYRVLVKGARAVLQFYPKDADQVAMITRSALNAGFSGGVVIDYPNSTKAKKFYLCILAGEPDTRATAGIPQALGVDVLGEPTQIQVNSNLERGNSRRKQRKPKFETRRQFVLRKKERQRRQGKDVRPDTKHTGRSRNIRF